MAKLTPKSKAVLDFVREHDNGDGVKMTDIAAGLGMTVKQIGPIVWTSLKEKKGGSRGALVSYEKRSVAGEEKPVGYVHITAEGKSYEDPEEEIAE